MRYTPLIQHLKYHEVLYPMWPRCIGQHLVSAWVGQGAVGFWWLHPHWPAPRECVSA